MRPSLSEAQKKCRIDFICDQVNETIGYYLDQGNVSHLNESWLFLLRNKAKVRIILDEAIPGSPCVQHKSRHLPKIMVNVANARPDLSHDFERKDRHLAHLRHENGRAIVQDKRRKKGDECDFDCAIDAEWCKMWYVDELLPAIKLKIAWLRSKRVVVQQDGASPHTGENNPEILNSAGMERGWMVELVVQPSQSPALTT